MKTLLEALKALDKDNAEHWTGEGLPRLDVVKEMTGSDVSRLDIAAVAPKFNRYKNIIEDQPVVAAPVAVQDKPEGVGETGAADDGVVDHNVVTEVLGEMVQDGEAAAQKELDEARHDLQAAQARMARANEVMDHYIQLRTPADSSTSFSQDVQAYQRAQQVAAQLDAGRAAALKAALKEMGFSSEV